jgi:hypothetical protein
MRSREARYHDWIDLPFVFLFVSWNQVALRGYFSSGAMIPFSLNDFDIGGEGPALITRYDWIGMESHNVMLI